jgi:hypothetical protein
MVVLLLVLADKSSLNASIPTAVENLLSSLEEIDSEELNGDSIPTEMENLFSDLEETDSEVLDGDAIDRLAILDP